MTWRLLGWLLRHPVQAIRLVRLADRGRYQILAVWKEPKETR